MQECRQMDLVTSKQTLHRVSDGANLVSWLSGQAVIKVQLKNINDLETNHTNLTLQISEAKALKDMLTKMLETISVKKIDDTYGLRD
jgi:hypothetical protein